MVPSSSMRTSLSNSSSPSLMSTKSALPPLLPSPPTKPLPPVDEPDGDVSSSVVAEPVPPDLPSDDSPTLNHLSLQAYHGTSGKCTIYFSGSIAGTTVRILLDGGSSDNLIQMEKIPKRKSQSNRWVNNEWDRLDPTATHIDKCSADASEKN
ncbi:unnamed protein product [Vicia faba]|uniref:Uncharacterized protein n=1 Tax=Vicia faba TaxID=3906 RepID=A0AAV1AHE8_VICFA|nr:unnamed protein product [Vicia faba]